MKNNAPSYLGFGLGLRPEHYEEIIRQKPTLDWFEIITENYLVPGGKPLYYLQKIRENYPMVMHGVSLSIGSVDPLDMTYLKEVKTLAERLEPAWISDHLCWTGMQGLNMHDLLPIPYTQQAIEHLVARIDKVQNYLGRQILLENVSSYLSYKGSEMAEWEFIAEIAIRAGCYLLLDVNNVYVSAVNHGFRPLDYIKGLPLERVMQIHLAGHSHEGDYLIDTHDSPIIPAVWELYAQTIKFCGQVSTSIERDDHIPPLADLLIELVRAKEIATHALAGDPPSPLERIDKAFCHRLSSSPLGSSASCFQSTEDRLSFPYEESLLFSTSHEGGLFSSFPEIENFFSPFPSKSSLFPPPPLSEKGAIKEASRERCSSDLANLQILLQNYLLGKVNGIESHINTSKNLPVATRLRIYANAYQNRLVEALTTNYPILHRYLGAEAFEKLALAYLESHPSSNRSIRWFGDKLVNYLAQIKEYSPYLAELAQFEWQLGLSFDAADEPVLTPEEITNIPPQDWAEMRFISHPSLQRSDFSWTVVPLWQVLSAKQNAAEPRKTAEKTAWILWRTQYVNHFNSLPKEEAWALDALISGSTFGEICLGLCEWLPEQEVGLKAASLLKGWVQAGMLAKVHIR